MRNGAGLKDAEEFLTSRMASAARWFLGGMHSGFEWLWGHPTRLQNLLRTRIHVPPDMLPSVLLCGVVILLMMLQVCTRGWQVFRIC